MKKLVLAVVVAGLVVAGAACGSGGGGTDAKSLYPGYVAKYGSSIDELGSAFGSEDSISGQSWDEFVASNASEECSEPLTGEEAAMAAVLFAPTLQKHGRNWVEFVNDTNQFNAALKAGGFCVAS